MLLKENEILKKQKEMYRKRFERAQKLNKMFPSPRKTVHKIISKGQQEVKRHLAFTVCLTKQIKSNYQTDTEKEKSIISKIFAVKIFKKYKVTKCLKGVYLTVKKGKNVDDKIKKDIYEFFCDDEITTQAPGKKDFITSKKEKLKDI